MKYINRVELQGIVGNTRSLSGRDNYGLAFSLATSKFKKKDDGTYDEITTWHNVVVWNAPGVIDFSQIQSGKRVHVIGEIRVRQFEVNGEKRTATDIYADMVDLVSCPLKKADMGAQPAAYDDDLPE